MSVTFIERQKPRFLIDGTSALKAEALPLRPELKIVPSSIDQELASSLKVVSISDFKERKAREAVMKAPEKAAEIDLLKGTGFTAREETKSLQDKFNTGIAEGKSIEEIENKIVTENLTNIRWYQWEYTMSDPVLINPVAHNENKELVNSKSGYSAVKGTSANERDGAVLESVVATENLLKNSKEGDTVMIVSPPGYTGRIDENGKEIIYPEAEIFAFIKGEGRNIRALTFISELTFEQCQQFKDVFITPDSEIANKKLTEKEQIADMVATPILVTGGRVNFEDILDKIQAIKGGEIMREANGANRTFAEAREFIQKGQEIHTLPNLCEEIIGEYEKYLREHIKDINNPQTAQLVQQRMEMTVLEIAKILKGGKDAPQKMSELYRQSIDISNIQSIDKRVFQDNYGQEIAYLMTRPGCNGGGSSSSVVFGSGLQLAFGGGAEVFSSGGGSVESSGSCVVCKKNDAIEGGCGFCSSCAAKAA